MTEQHLIEIHFTGKDTPLRIFFSNEAGVKGAFERVSSSDGFVEILGALNTSEGSRLSVNSQNIAWIETEHITSGTVV